MYSVLKKQTTSNWGPNRKSHSAALQNCAIPFFWKLYTVLCFLFSKGTAWTCVARCDKATTGFGAGSHIWFCTLWLPSQTSKPPSVKQAPWREDVPFGPDVHLQIYGGQGSRYVRSERLPLCDHSPLVWMRIQVLVILCLSAPPDLQDSFSLLVMTFSCPYDRQSQFDKGNYSLWMP